VGQEESAFFKFQPISRRSYHKNGER